MMARVVGLVVLLLSLGYGLLAMTANMMSDNPSDKAAGWPCGVGLLLAVSIIVGHHYGAW